MEEFCPFSSINVSSDGLVIEQSPRWNSAHLIALFYSAVCFTDPSLTAGNLITFVPDHT